MKLSRLLLVPAVLALLAPMAGAHAFSGNLSQGDVAVLPVNHHNGLVSTCLDVVTTWTVTLAYAPASDVLTLSVPEFGQVDVGRGGQASVSFTTLTSCADFTIVVHGTLVKRVAAYTVGH